MAKFTTRDVGFAIRDHLDDKLITQIAFDRNGTVHEGEQCEVASVDVSDPDNPVVHLTNGQSFTLVICAR